MRPFNSNRVPRAGVIALVCAAAGWCVARSAAAAPVQWIGAANGAWVRLFVDGQKCAGGVDATFAGGPARLELSGSGSGLRYSGTLTGTGWKGDASYPLRGTFQATMGGGSERIQLTVRPAGTAAAVYSVPLREQQYQPLFCAWCQGTVTRKPAEGTPVPLVKGGAVQVGDRIETGGDGRAVVVLGDSSVVMMQESTRIEVPRVPENEGRVQKVGAKGGKVWFAVKKVQQGSKFEVETDEAVAAVRGTEFLVEVGDQGEFSLTTAEGQVDVTESAPAHVRMAVMPGMRCRCHRPVGDVQSAPARALVPQPLPPLMQNWEPLLREADRHWPYRRLGKRGFWQDRLKSGGPRGAPPAQREPGALRPKRVPEGAGPEARPGPQREGVSSGPGPKGDLRPRGPRPPRPGRERPEPGGPPPVPHKRPGRREPPPEGNG